MSKKNTALDDVGALTPTAHGCTMSVLGRSAEGAGMIATETASGRGTTGRQACGMRPRLARDADGHPTYRADLARAVDAVASSLEGIRMDLMHDTAAEQAIRALQTVCSDAFRALDAGDLTYFQTQALLKEMRAALDASDEVVPFYSADPWDDVDGGGDL